ncbi:MAG: GbsR/MarR family transcriptional regulator [Pseudonocardiaceae bacterium]
MDAEGRSEELVRFADVIGLLYEDLGMPRAWGRVLGWLLVCEPVYQSAEELAAGLHASRGSISMATRSLIRMGNIERQTRRGDRRTYYGIRPGAWTSVFEHQTQTATKLRQLAKQGLELLDDEPTERRVRLQELHDLTTFYERASLAMLSQWNTR